MLSIRIRMKINENLKTNAIETEKRNSNVRKWIYGESTNEDIK